MSTKLRGSLKQQSYVPLEKVTSHVANKYEAVVVAAAEARKINSVLRMVGRDEALEKVTSRALRRICTGDIDFVYLDESERLAEAAAFAEEAAAVSAVDVSLEVPKQAAKEVAAEAPAEEEPDDFEAEEDDETPLVD